MGEKPMTSMTLLTCEASALQYCTVASPSQTTLELPIGLLSNSLAEELIAFEEVYLHKYFHNFSYSVLFYKFAKNIGLSHCFKLFKLFQQTKSPYSLSLKAPLVCTVLWLRQPSCLSCHTHEFLST